MVDFDTQYYELLALGTNGLAACTICFLQNLNYIEVQKNLFGINAMG